MRYVAWVWRIRSSGEQLSTTYSSVCGVFFESFGWRLLVDTSVMYFFWTFSKTGQQEAVSESVDNVRNAAGLHNEALAIVLIIAVLWWKLHQCATAARITLEHNVDHGVARNALGLEKTVSLVRLCSFNCAVIFVALFLHELFVAPFAGDFFTSVSSISVGYFVAMFIGDCIRSCIRVYSFGYRPSIVCWIIGICLSSVLFLAAWLWAPHQGAVGAVCPSTMHHDATNESEAMFVLFA